MLGILRREPEDLFSVHDGLPQAIGDLNDAVLGGLVADGIEID